MEKIPSMTGDNFMGNEGRFDQSLRYPKTKPPRSVSSKKSNNSEKSSSLLDSEEISSRDPRGRVVVTLSELASQKVSQVRGRSGDKKK